MIENLLEGFSSALEYCCELLDLDHSHEQQKDLLDVMRSKLWIIFGNDLVAKSPSINPRQRIDRNDYLFSLLEPIISNPVFDPIKGTV